MIAQVFWFIIWTLAIWSAIGWIDQIVHDRSFSDETDWTVALLFIGPFLWAAIIIFFF